MQKMASAIGMTETVRRALVDVYGDGYEHVPADEGEDDAEEADRKKGQIDMVLEHIKRGILNIMRPTKRGTSARRGLLALWTHGYFDPPSVMYHFRTMRKLQRPTGKGLTGLEDEVHLRYAVRRLQDALYIAEQRLIEDQRLNPELYAAYIENNLSWMFSVKEPQLKEARDGQTVV